MIRVFFLAALLLPVGALAAPAPSFVASNDLVVASSTPGNAYVSGASVVVSGPVAGDLTALAGGIVLAAPVGGDALLLAGVAGVRAPVAGNLRALAARVSVEAPVGGDEVAAAASFSDTAGTAKNVFVIADNASLSGARGPVIIYANNVALAGSFASDVRVVALGRVALAPGTHIQGSLTYESPETAVVPASAVVAGGVHYTGASYLPGAGEAKAIALAGVGVFLAVELIGALILAGLFAGLFPALAETVASDALDRGVRRVLLSVLLGFALLVATPILLVLLAITLVGLGLAFVIGVAYLLLLFLAFIYISVIIGSLLARRIAKRTTVLWRDAIFGMLVVYLISIVPIVGGAVVLILLALSTGVLAQICYHFAFPKSAETSHLL